MFVKSVSQASNGNVTLSAQGLYVTYVPHLDWSGVDFFTYEVSDGVNTVKFNLCKYIHIPCFLILLKVSSNVTVTVLFVNHAPQAMNDSEITAYQNSSVAIPVMDNDFDKDGGILFIYFLNEIFVYFFFFYC